MTNRHAPFYPGEIVTGQVEALHNLFATVKLAGGYLLPLERRFIDWQPVYKTSDVLSLGDRIQAVVWPKSAMKSTYRCRTLEATIQWKGFWLDCLPLIEDPLVDFQARYPVGSQLEVQFVRYVNHYIAHARTADGLIIELMNRDLHPEKRRKSTELSCIDLLADSEYSNPSFAFSLLPEQCLQIAIRRYDQRTIRSKRLT